MDQTTVLRKLSGEKRLARRSYTDAELREFVKRDKKDSSILRKKKLL